MRKLIILSAKPDLKYLLWFQTKRMREIQYNAKRNKIRCVKEVGR